MIKYVRHHSIDREKYDHCIRLDESGLAYGFSWYLDTVCENWDALVLDDYSAVWPLPVREKWGIKYFYRPFAVQQLGVFSKKKITEEVLLDFITIMQRHCRYAEIFLNEEQFTDFKKLKNISVSLRLNLRVNLNASYREVYHRFKPNTRRVIKKAGEANLQLFEHDDPEALMNIFRHTKGVTLKLPEEFFRSMTKAMYRCLHNGMGKIWTVYGPHNSICAGAFFVQTEKRHILLSTALTPEGKELGAMYFLLNEYFIFESAKRGIFDFEGSSNPGVARFYRSFGADEVYYPRLVYNNLPWPLRGLKKTRE